MNCWIDENPKPKCPCKCLRALSLSLLSCCCSLDFLLLLLFVSLGFHAFGWLYFHFFLPDFVPVGGKDSPVRLLEGLHHRALRILVRLRVDVFEERLECRLSLWFLLLLKLLKLTLEFFPVLWGLLLLLLKERGSGVVRLLVLHPLLLVVRVFQVRPLRATFALVKLHFYLRRKQFDFRFLWFDLAEEVKFEDVRSVLMSIVDAHRHGLLLE
mmetsp:Transcript_10426/g.19600  ORF Transcript_10426/g.19600 Transcript_10426/m.19600 type:complete len:212 (-) Transcript_10426:300-935(-)